jgi:cold shock protein
MRGVVAWFNNVKSFGFITPTGGGQDYFVHYTGIIGEGFRTLNQGDRVEFDVDPNGPKGKTIAVNVRVIEGSK